MFDSSNTTEQMDKYEILSEIDRLINKLNDCELDNFDKMSISGLITSLVNLLAN